MAGGSFLWKVAGLGSAAVVGIAARKTLTATWKLATGTAPPTNPEDPDIGWRGAVGWATLSGVVVGLARLAVARKLAATSRRRSGSRAKDVGVTP